MPIQAPPYIWHNGEIKPWHEATVHVLSHALHYGSSVFEGIRVYDTPGGAVAFRLDDHLNRLHDSARIHRIPMRWSVAQLHDACRELIECNELDSAYLRPIVFRGYGELGICPGEDASTETAIAAVHWGAYLGEESLERGVDVCVSSWNRVAPNTIPAAAKAGGNYLSSQLISGEAKRLGFDEGIALAADGQLSEGAGENLFLVRHGTLYTPPQAASILAGITRDSVLQLARGMDIPCEEQTLPRESLYLADELFFTGTAAEITPIRSVDGIPVRCAGRGPITQRLQQAFFGLFDSSTEDRWGWLQSMTTPEVRRGSTANAV